MPEDVDTSGNDVVSGASVLVKNNERIGSTEYVAQVIGEHIGADLFRIEPEQPYPLEHELLVDFAAEEQEKDSRPAIQDSIENLNNYDTIFVGYPNWWGDMPMILYTFFDEYDLSGKTIIPFSTHGGSGFSNTISTIAELEPDAEVYENGFTVSRNTVAEAENDVVAWLEEIGF